MNLDAFSHSPLCGLCVLCVFFLRAYLLFTILKKKMLYKFTHKKILLCNSLSNETSTAAETTPLMLLLTLMMMMMKRNRETAQTRRTQTTTTAPAAATTTLERSTCPAAAAETVSPAAASWCGAVGASSLAQWPGCGVPTASPVLARSAA